MEVLGLGKAAIHPDGRMIGIDIDTGVEMVQLEGNVATMETLVFNLIRLIAEAKKIRSPTSIAETWDATNALVTTPKDLSKVVMGFRVPPGFDLHIGLEKAIANLVLARLTEAVARLG